MDRLDIGNRFSGDSPREWSYRFSWVHLTRPMTLTGTICPVLAGTALAAENGSVRPDMFVAVLIAALLVQMATNLFNDYFDVLHGQDRDKWATPEDPKHGAGPAHRAIPTVAGLMLSVAVVLGAYLAWSSHGWVAVVGTAGILCGYAYSAGPRPLSSLGLGELIAALFLGTAVTVIAYAVQGAPPDGRVFAASLPFSFLIASMILSNNIRDIEKDRAFRRTLAIRLGRAGAARLLSAILLLAYLSLAVLIGFRLLPWTAGLAWLAFPLALRLRHAYRVGAERREEMGGMKWAAWHHWAYGLLYAAGIWLSL
ncbi:1,4-dihydroxy-2-naphthoate octaprenyltransferase [Planifilum fimeticola]|uniref:1,4-dihydroxy-2-naphthoate octaprenyltransferase n=1 Tax=Planifilum fimeticola TaxID=201975 RepID=A0A2T0LGT8_9BACL|nr:1,4-dihydroxy-2-naphthoate octaprenyltransferase [Planifilum fimeticola]